ncbi:MAG: response regulator transcription factor [Anaerolineae bacterium]|nr:response regulator transcription factor [Anaerolineae bacterium]
MAQNSETLNEKLAFKAEGSPDDRERREPISSLRTSTVPAVKEPLSTIPTSDTGINMTVRLKVEGAERNETQDSSLTEEEKQATPLTASAQKTEVQSDADASAEAENQPATILIVEDTVELGEVIEATLEGIGLTAYHETRGTTGLEKLKEVNPEVVVMDIGLPDITGWKMLDQIKEHFASIEKDMPAIIVITAFGDPANRLIGKLQNIHSYLIKPFTPDQVERLVTMALNGEKPEEPDIDSQESAAG